MVIGKIVSKEQGGFIEGKSSQAHIMLASKMVNEMDRKKFGGNAVIKLDISQAYDSLNWSFLEEVPQ